MWHPAISAGAVTEPVSLDDAKRQCHILPADTSFDVEITRLIKVARNHVEERCGMLFGARAITIECDCFADFSERWPYAPLSAVGSVTYTDAAGDEQTLGTSVYRVGGTRFAPCVELKPDQSWPEIEYGSRVAVDATFGSTTPEEVAHAMLLLIGHWFAVREAVNVGNIVSAVPMAVDMLLSNELRGAYA